MSLPWQKKGYATNKLLGIWEEMYHADFNSSATNKQCYKQDLTNLFCQISNRDHVQIQIFTDAAPVSEDIAPFAIDLAKDKELKELYTDWEILQFKCYVFEDEHPNVPKHLHTSNKIVARRIK